MVKVIELSPTMGNGGAETLIKDYALLADAGKIDMRVVTWCGTLGSANEEHLAKAGIQIVHLEELRYAKGATLNPLQRVHRKIGRFIDFRRYIIKEQPDVIHIHLRFGGYIRMLPLRKLNVRLFYTVHNELEQYFDKRPFSKKWLEYCEARRLIRKYSMTMVTLHEDMNRSIRKYFNTDRVVTVHNGVNLARFKNELYDRNATRDLLGIDRDVTLLGHVGSVHTQKNHEMIIDIYEEYLKKDATARLLLVGKGNKKKEIKELIEAKGLTEKVVFLEDRTDVPALMNAMDVFVMPSRWEGYPVVLIEAQSLGLPCVVSDRITNECVLTDKIAMLSIEDSATKWCDVIAAAAKDKIAFMTHCMKPVANVEDYDIVSSIRTLEKMYMA